MRRFLPLLLLLFCPLPASAQFNPWVNQGTVISTSVVASPGQPNVFYEANPQLISANGDGKVFKMWYDNAASPYGLYYAESNDGLTWTQDPGNPIVAGLVAVKLFKYGTTYYLYANPGWGGTAIKAYTCTDGTGTNFTLQNSTALVSGSGGAWDSAGLEQLGVAAVVSGTWYGYYTGWDSAFVGYLSGLATSTDGLTWASDSGNPIAALDAGTLANGQPYLGSGNFTFAKVGATYYTWSQTATTSFPGSLTVAFNLPSDIMRWSAPAANGPWTPLGTLTYYRTVASEGVGDGLGQVADPSIVFALGNAYLFYTAVANGTIEATTGVINAAIATGTTPAQLVSSYEGVRNVPIAVNPSLNLNVLASDDFLRADANPIGGNWSPFQSSPGYTTAQLLSHAFASSTVANSDSFWNALSWANDQWSQITVGVCAASSTVGIDLRASTSGALNVYRLFWTGSTGSPGTWTIQTVVSGSYDPRLSGTLTVNVGDTLTGVVVGTNIMFYWNGLLLGILSDSSVGSGAPGALVNPTTSVSNATITSWSGGNFKDAPTIAAGIIQRRR